MYYIRAPLNSRINWLIWLTDLPVHARFYSDHSQGLEWRMRHIIQEKFFFFFKRFLIERGKTDRSYD